VGINTRVLKYGRENRVNRLRYRDWRAGERLEIYKVVGCLMPYRLCAVTSAQLKLSSVRFMQQREYGRYFLESTGKTELQKVNKCHGLMVDRTGKH
jgi:hypothetical protein